MRLPTRESIEGLRPIARNLTLDLISAIGYGISGALVSTLLPTIARRGGLEPIGLAALSAAPFLTNLLSVFAGRVGPQSTPQFALLRAIGAGSLVGLFFVPGATVIVVVVFVFWISVSFSSPFQLRLWGATYPGRMRGRIVGFLGMGRAAAAGVAALAGGVIADPARLRPPWAWPCSGGPPEGHAPKPVDRQLRSRACDRDDGASLGCGDAPDTLGGGASPRVHGRRTGSAASRSRPAAECSGGDRLDLRRDVRRGARGP